MTEFQDYFEVVQDILTNNDYVICKFWMGNLYV